MKTGGFRTPEAHGKFPEPQGGGFSYLLGKILDWDWDRKEYGHGGSLKFPGFGVMGVMGVSDGPKMPRYLAILRQGLGVQNEGKCGVYPAKKICRFGEEGPATARKNTPHRQTIILGK